MKEMNLPETRLRSWRPRRPSAGLKRRLFAAPFRVGPHLAQLLGWMAPATACVLLTFSIFNSGNSLANGAAGQEPMVAMMLSNQGYASYVSDRFQADQNRLSSVTFDLTNRSGSTSSLGPASRGGKN